jgi:hypothetical protein
MLGASELNPLPSAGPPDINLSELLARWEREDFRDCLPDWHRVNLWRRRCYWDRDYVFRF